MSDRDLANSVFDEVYKEREYQATKWANGDPTELDKNDDLKVDRPDSWCLWIDRYKGSWNGYAFPFQYIGQPVRIVGTKPSSFTDSNRNFASGMSGIVR